LIRGLGKKKKRKKKKGAKKGAQNPGSTKNGDPKSILSWAPFDQKPQMCTLKLFYWSKKKGGGGGGSEKRIKNEKNTFFGAKIGSGTLP